MFLVRYISSSACVGTFLVPILTNDSGGFFPFPGYFLTQLYDDDEDFTKIMQLNICFQILWSHWLNIVNTPKQQLRVFYIKCFQTVLTPFDLFCAETLLRMELEWVQNVAILCQNGQFGTTLCSTLQMEDRECIFCSSLAWQQNKSKFIDKTTGKKIYLHTFPIWDTLWKMVADCICYICDAVFALSKYTVDINRPRLQYFSSKQTFHCILKEERTECYLPLRYIDSCKSCL